MCLSLHAQYLIKYLKVLTLFLPSFRTCTIFEDKPQLQLGYWCRDPVARGYLLEMAKNISEMI